MATKGFKGFISYDGKTDQISISAFGWGNATTKYNGGGAAKYGQNYTASVWTMAFGAQAPQASNYK